jgi:uncharacterized protein (DUF2267 family)
MGTSRLAPNITTMWPAMPGFLNLPGTVGADSPETGAARGRASGALLDRLAPRLGSEVQGEKLLLAALAPLRVHLHADTWDALLDELPYPLRVVLRDPVPRFGRVPRLEHAEPYVAFVADRTQHPEERAAAYVRAVLAVVREGLPPGLVEAVEGELPPSLAALWTGAR